MPSLKRRKGLRLSWAMTGGLALLALLLIGYKFRDSRAADTKAFLLRPQENALAAAPGITSLPARGEQDHPITPPPPHPSLAGTSVNGGLRLDKNGRIILHRDVRRLFDYYLSLRGRMSNQEIRQLLIQHLTASPLAGATGQALGLFDAYLEMIEAEARMTENWTGQDLKTADQVTAVLEERRQLRREHLGDALSEAFYADQETYESYQLERMRISSNPALDESQKEAALADAESLLTPEQREIRHQTFAWLDVKKAAQQPIESIDAAAADAIRQRFGEGALDRLAAVEKDKNAWDQKRAAWLAEKSRIGAQADLSPADRKKALEAYARAHLDPIEIRRMEALDSDPLP